MNTLAIDIGGTKFTVALFEGTRMIRRESRATDREGGPEWMLPGRFSRSLRDWKFDRCGIGFGGPSSTSLRRPSRSLPNVGGWNGFPAGAAWIIQERFPVPRSYGQRR